MKAGGVFSGEQYSKVKLLLFSDCRSIDFTLSWTRGESELDTCCKKNLLLDAFFSLQLYKLNSHLWQVLGVSVHSGWILFLL